MAEKKKGFRKGFLKKMKDVKENIYSSIIEDGTIYDTNENICTGNLLLNAQLSGSMFKGIPSTCRLGLAGEKSTGKSFLALKIMENWLNSGETYYSEYFETEGAIDKERMESRKIDTSRVIGNPVKFVEHVKEQAVRMISAYEKEVEVCKKDGYDIPRCLMILDSIGMLSTLDELESVEGMNKKSAKSVYEFFNSK